MTNPVNPLRQYNSLQSSSKIVENNSVSITNRIPTQKDLFIDRDATAFGPKRSITQIFKDVLNWIQSLLSKAASFFTKSPSKNEEVNENQEEEVQENEVEDEIHEDELNENQNEQEVRENQGSGEVAEEEVHSKEKLDKPEGKEEVREDHAEIERLEKILNRRKQMFYEMPPAFKLPILEAIKRRNARDDVSIEQLDQEIMDYHYSVESKGLKENPQNVWVNLANPESIINQEIHAFLALTRRQLEVLNEAIRENQIVWLIQDFDLLNPAIKDKIYELMTLDYTTYSHPVAEEKATQILEEIQRNGNSGDILLCFPPETLPRQCRLLDRMIPAVEKTLRRVKLETNDFDQLTRFNQTLKQANEPFNPEAIIGAFETLSDRIRQEIAKEMYRETLVPYTKELLRTKDKPGGWAYDVIHQTDDFVEESVSLHYRGNLFKENSLFRKSLGILERSLNKTIEDLQNPIEV